MLKLTVNFLMCTLPFHLSGLLCVVCSYPENIMPDTEGVEPKTMTIGTNNVFEVGCGILYS